MKYSIITYPFYLTILLSMVFFSCEKELEIEPAQSISVSTALGNQENVLNVLIGTYEEIGQNATYGGRTQVFADLLGNTDQVNWEGTFIQPRQAITKNILVDNSFVRDIWGNSYEVINQANLVLDNLDKIEDTSISNQTEGEARFLRALTYFDLIRLFGSADGTRGVPLRLTGITDYSVDLSIGRNSSTEIYNQILDDLQNAYTNLPSSNEFFADKYAARALEARVALHTGNFSLARDAADDVIQNSGHELTATFAQAFNNDNDSSEDVFALQVTSQGGDNDLIIFYASQSNGGRGGDIVLQQGYFDLFDDLTNDSRASFNYVSPDNGGILTSKYINQFGNIPVIRLAEMYLIRAEGNLRLNSSVGNNPTDDINLVRVRSNATSYSGTVTLAQIWNERQLELAFEGHLLYDFRRTERSIGEFEHNNNKLVLPIPQTEIDANSIITQNDGY